MFIIWHKKISRVSRQRVNRSSLLIKKATNIIYMSMYLNATTKVYFFDILGKDGLTYGMTESLI